MADRFYVWYSIGGVLTSTTRDALAEVISERVGSGDLPPGYPSITFRIDEAIEKGETLDFGCDEVAYGQIEELEDFCMEHGLEFSALVSADYGIPEELRVWHPELPLDKDGERVSASYESTSGAVVLTVRLLEQMQEDGTWPARRREYLRAESVPSVPLSMTPCT
jgi:hypothetical protein